MNAIETDRAALAVTLAAAGVAVTLDPATVAPFVLIAPPSWSLGPGKFWTLVYPVKIVATGPGNVDAHTWMTDQLERVLTAVPCDRADPTTERAGDADLPAYVVELTRQISPPDC